MELKEKRLIVVIAAVILASSTLGTDRARAGLAAFGESSIRIFNSMGNRAFDVLTSTSPAQVILGRGGTNGTDMDLRVIDPDSTQVTENVVLIDASTGGITLGSGSVAVPGEDGDLLIENGLGDVTAQIDGAGGNLFLGSGSEANPSADGDIQLEDGQGDVTIHLDGETGNLYQDTFFSADEGNGAVKAWARINSDGTIFNCWRCDTDPAQTMRVGSGVYLVAFDVGANIDPRPKLATLIDNLTANSIGVLPGDDPLSVTVIARQSNGTPVDSTFYVFLF